MQLITKNYLTSIIFRAVNETLEIRRASQKNLLFYLDYPTATEEELLDFIQSCPFYDAGLQQYLMPPSIEESIIISQLWETSFIVKTKQWANANQWLHVDVIFSIGFYTKYFNSNPETLKLPY